MPVGTQAAIKALTIDQVRSTGAQMILANAYHYVLEWDAPFQRIAYWNRFGEPEGSLTRVGDYRDMPSLWWVEPDKEKQLAQAMKDERSSC